MINTSNIITNLNDVPMEWVFEHYLELGEKLSGQEIRMKSIFNENDKTPSMYIFVNNGGKYYFMDFSTGKKGDAVELVKLKEDFEFRTEAARKIINDYSEFIKNGSYQKNTFEPSFRYKLKEYKLRTWTKQDAGYWTEYHIDSKTLEFFKVKPLELFTLSKEDNKEIVVSGSWIYGYFRVDGSIYKIYRPKDKERKFFKVDKYIHGEDQLTFTKPNLIIASSLKDMMPIHRMDFNAEIVAPESENVIIPKAKLDYWKTKYQKICTVFDNDDAGINSMHLYEKQFNIGFAHLRIEKDVADAVKSIGLLPIKKILHPLLKEALNRPF
jgi:hypothetical protein